MKKILLATTMLASVAGYAAADVSVSGDARMGVVSTEGNSVFNSRVRIKFSGSGTTDGGLSFGGSFRAKDAAGANSGTAGSAFISGAFGKISMGDVDGGDNAAVGQLASVGYTGLGSGNSISYTSDGGFVGFDSDVDGGYSNDYELYLDGNAGAKVLYTYSAGAVSVSASSAQLSNGDANLQAYGLGAAYTAGALTLAVGYGTTDVSGNAYDYVSDEDNNASGSITDVSASATYVMGDTTIKAIYQDKSAELSYDSDDSGEQFDGEIASAVSMGASVVHKMDAVSLTAYAITTELSSDWADFDISLNRMGVGVGYDLGGGATLQAGWAEVEVASEGDDTPEAVSQSAFDAGVNFSF